MAKQRENSTRADVQEAYTLSEFRDALSSIYGDGKSEVIISHLRDLRSENIGLQSNPDKFNTLIHKIKPTEIKQALMRTEYPRTAGIEYSRVKDKIMELRWGNKESREELGLPDELANILPFSMFSSEMAAPLMQVALDAADKEQQMSYVNRKKEFANYYNTASRIIRGAVIASQGIYAGAIKDGHTTAAENGASTAAGIVEKVPLFGPIAAAAGGIAFGAYKKVDKKEKNNRLSQAFPTKSNEELIHDICYIMTKGRENILIRHEQRRLKKENSFSEKGIIQSSITYLSEKAKELNERVTATDIDTEEKSLAQEDAEKVLNQFRKANFGEISRDRIKDLVEGALGVRVPADNIEIPLLNSNRQPLPEVLQLRERCAVLERNLQEEKQARIAMEERMLELEKTIAGLGDTQVQGNSFVRRTADIRRKSFSL